MSRHMLAAFNAAHKIIVGWDRPMNTFFAQLINTDADEDSDSRTVLWIGAGFDEVPDPAVALDALRPFALVPDGLLKVLLGEPLASTAPSR